MIFSSVEWHDALPSTQDLLVDLARQGKRQEGAVVAARIQTAGRGRGQRTWLSAPGKDLAFSFLISCPPPSVPIGDLGMAAALGMAEALHAWGVQARLKWPNDVLVGGRKIAGILIDRLAGDDRGLAVVGIGLNVNMPAEDLQRLPAATSLQRETGRDYEVSDVLAEVLAHLQPWLAKWKIWGWEALRERWEELSVYRQGHAVCLKTDANSRCGILLGYGEHGEMLLRNAGGEVEAIWSGEMENADV